MAMKLSVERFTRYQPKLVSHQQFYKINNSIEIQFPWCQLSLAQVIFIEDLKDPRVSHFQFSCVHIYTYSVAYIHYNNIGADDFLLFLGERTNQYERQREAIPAM